MFRRDCGNGGAALRRSFTHQSVQIAEYLRISSKKVLFSEFTLQRGWLWAEFESLIQLRSVWPSSQLEPCDWLSRNLSEIRSFWHQRISGSSFRCRDIANPIFCDGLRTEKELPFLGVGFLNNSEFWNSSEILLKHIQEKSKLLWQCLVHFQISTVNSKTSIFPKQHNWRFRAHF